MDKEIILMRHGKPETGTQGKLPASDMHDWVSRYHASALLEKPVPRSALKMAMQATIVATSHMATAISSVDALGMRPTVVDSVFAEAQLPMPNWRGLRLPPSTWTSLLRTLWLLGHTAGLEPIAQARARATLASIRLQLLARQGNVLLVGHRLMNHLISKELLAAGWHCREKAGRGYWAYCTYRLSSKRWALDHSGRSFPSL